MLVKFANVMVVASGAIVFIVAWTLMAVMGVAYIITDKVVFDDIAEDMFDFAQDVRKTIEIAKAGVRK